MSRVTLHKHYVIRKYSEKKENSIDNKNKNHKFFMNRLSKNMWNFYTESDKTLRNKKKPE